jgi:hypothetical protein
MEHSDLRDERPVKKTKAEQERSFDVMLIALGAVCVALKLFLPDSDPPVRRIFVLLAGAFVAAAGVCGLLEQRRPGSRRWRAAEYACVGLCLAAFGVSVWFSPDRSRDLWSFFLLFGVAVWNLIRRRRERKKEEDSENR